MARFFNEQDIDAFRDCFYMKCKSGVMNNKDDLSFVMRSVGMCPTIKELNSYMKMKNNKISFADFLDVAHSHKKTENIPEEISKAFKYHNQLIDSSAGIGKIKTKEFRRVLCHCGEKLNAKQFDNFLNEASLSSNAPTLPTDQLAKNFVMSKI